METKKEHKIEVIKAILDETVEGKSDRYLTNKLELGYALLPHCLDFLLRMGLILVEPLGEGKMYRTTEKGRKFLQSYETVEKIIQTS